MIPRRLCPYQNIDWHPEYDELIVSKRAERATHSEIAAELGCSTKAVQRRLRRLGLPTRRMKWKAGQ